MQPVVLLAVAAVWAAVIIPPLLRSRSENRPNSSVTDFRRQLSTLQRAVPTRTMVPVRGMARPLTQAPPMQARGATRTHGGAVHPGHPGQVRRAGGDQHHRQMHLHRVSQREIIRRRRANVLFLLVVTVGITGFLAATTHASAMMWVFALSFIALCGYCYKLAQIRAYQLDRQHDQQWFHAA